MVELGRVGIVGGSGWLGTAIARALLGSGIVFSDKLICSHRSGRPGQAVDCVWTGDNRELAARSDVIILSVRPGDWPTVDIDARGKLVVSVMAGVTVASIKERTGSSRVARALPNAAAEIGYSYTPYHMSSINPADDEIVAALFSSCGTVDSISREEHIDYFTAMTGSGAAFPALLAEALMNDAIGRGVPPDVALRAARQVIIGAGRLQERLGTSPSETVEAFVDYKGTTAAGIVAMRQMGFESAVYAGLEAAFRRAQSLSSQ